MIRRMAKKKPKNEVVLMVRMDATKHRKFKTFAFKSKRSMADLVRAYVDAVLALRHSAVADQIVMSLGDK